MGSNQSRSKKNTISYMNTAQFKFDDTDDIVYCYIRRNCVVPDDFVYVGYTTKRDVNLNENHFGIVYYKLDNVVFFPSRTNYATILSSEKYPNNVRGIHDLRPNVTE